MLNPIYARQTIPSPGHLGGEKGRHQQICDDLVHSGRGLFFRRSHRLYYLLDLQKVLRVVQSRANFSLGVGGGGGGQFKRDHVAGSCCIPGVHYRHWATMYWSAMIHGGVIMVHSR